MAYELTSAGILAAVLSSIKSNYRYFGLVTACQRCLDSLISYSACAIHCHLYKQSVGYEVGLVFEHQLTVLSHSRAELLADYRAGTSQFSMWSV